MTDTATNRRPRPLTPDNLGDRLVDVLALLGPVYRKSQRLVEDNERIEGVSIGVRAVLDLLREHGPMTVPQMAREQSLSRQFVQRMTNDALAKGWVETTANPAHKRSSLIALTAAGSDLIATVVRREHQALSQTPGELTGDDIDGCIRVLDGLLRNLQHVNVD
ncbi:MarR family transcriptional regulator [Epidermidibacterium keratini]|uniref:MarR family transcriptional regulator n=1 Tax=Epidermidibacterium keratini TaxID=1891644 RepID=A0A7L4YLU9_9ACTN|nr:MarR family transcriptional regulator [Epidermidibacterium keratini]QHC00022.1 MarR family transcriptional regulator [Epidermidibacterium keratini]